MMSIYPKTFYLEDKNPKLDKYSKVANYYTKQPIKGFLKGEKQCLH